MIFRLTSKLAKKLGTSPLSSLSYDKNKNPLIDWNAHLFTAQRTQYIILTNTASLYSMVMHGRGITDDKHFVRAALSCMKEFLTMSGNNVIFQTLIEPQDQEVFFSKIIDRRILGSMNDLVFQAKVHLIECHQAPLDVSFLLNKCPMSYLNYSCPNDQFRRLFFIHGKSLRRN